MQYFNCISTHAFLAEWKDNSKPNIKKRDDITPKQLISSFIEMNTFISMAVDLAQS